MSKVQLFQISEEDYSENLQELFSFLAKHDNPKTIREYLESVLTESELVMISRRIEIAKLLLAGHSYEEIMKKMRVGNDTVMRVKSSLKKFLTNQKKFQQMKRRGSSAPYGSFEQLRKTYKGYFALINAFIKE